MPEYNTWVPGDLWKTGEYKGAIATGRCILTQEIATEMDACAASQFVTGILDLPEARSIKA